MKQTIVDIIIISHAKLISTVYISSFIYVLAKCDYKLEWFRMLEWKSRHITFTVQI